MPSGACADSLRERRRRFAHQIELTFESIERASSASELRRIRCYVDNLLGRSSVAPGHPLQEVARATFVPGILNVPWRDCSQMQVARALEANYPGIKAEFLEARSAQARLPEYGRAAHHRDGDVYNNATGRWSALYLRRAGEPISTGTASCPLTWQLLNPYDLAGEVVFSVLAPGAAIAPHSDRENFLLTLHLGIIVPPGARFTVGNETRQWREGRCLAFESSFIHSVQNPDDCERVVLLVDIWHPDLSQAEVAALKALLATMKAAATSPVGEQAEQLLAHPFAHSTSTEC